MNPLRALPSIDALLRSRETALLIARFGRPLTLEALRATLETIRSQYQPEATLPDAAQIVQFAAEQLEHWTTPTLRSVINATGVIIHTNLGRAPLSSAAIHAMQAIAHGYNTLEFDLTKGARGSRLVHAEDVLCRLTGAESALVVNNNAAAVLLALSALARRRNVVIARTQLIEIGGGFRIPDILKQSGAKLIEIGATNRVHLRDYQQAIAEENPALILRAHRSNFRLVGFTGEPSLNQIAEAAHAAGLPLIDDLGSGTLLDTARFGLPHEPTIQESLAAGADVVCFSGDKLLGGPQAGILVGRSHLLQKMKKHPLMRALRADKLCLAALNATLLHYLKDEAERQIPVWQMIAGTPEQMHTRATQWAQTLGKGEIRADKSTIGGGSLPEETLPTFVLALKAANPKRLLARLRSHQPAIIARIQDDAVLLDPRTVLPEQENALLVGLQNSLGKKP
ncbi:MAG: L-seryl-tRNA(Sec) selenium transferase [Anaerolineales bacterium]